MRRHIFTLAAFILAASSTFLSLAATHANPDFDFAVADPAGDTFGVGPVQHDIVSVSGVSDGTNFIVTVEFADAVAEPDSGSPTKVQGFVTFDADQDLATGINVDADIAQFCPGPLGLGAEQNLQLFNYAGGVAPLYDFAAASSTDVPVTFGVNSFTATIPISALGGDELFNFAVLAGGNDPQSDEEITDCAPGDGGFIDTADYLPTPTVTKTAQPPTVTQALPTPTSTVAAVTLPATGLDSGSRGGWLPWLLLGAGVAGAIAGLAAFSRHRAR
ncbi:MAG: hypothetical protein WBD55_08515 [Dehalococcoidia bacterium]